MIDVGIPYGVTIEDLNTAGENCDNGDQICYLEGFSWADSIGWTYWTGLNSAGTEGLQTALGAADFPDEYIAKATYKGSLGGFVWGEKYGWVALSACNSIDVEGTCNGKSYCTWTTNGYCEIDKTGNIPDVSTQTKDDWGVYIDFCPLKTDQPACENLADDSDTYCNWDNTDNVCVFDVDNNPNGQPFKGYAWSQYLGWIKFGPEASDTEFSGALTNWLPDLTPPEFTALNSDGAWIPNESASGTIIWEEFADENDSYVDLLTSTIRIDTTIGNGGGGNFEGCPDIIAGPYANGDLIISHGGTGEAHLNMPEIGRIGIPKYGFCKYELTGVLYNSSGFGHYFGSDAAVFAGLDGVDISSLPISASPNTYNNDDVILYVRAGDIDSGVSAVYFTNNDVIADGNDSIDLTFSPYDIAGNPIVSVKSDLSGSLPEPNPDNWVRDATLLFDLDTSSQYHFDSIDWTRDIAAGNPPPIDINWTTYLSGEPLQYPPGGIDNMPQLIGNYYLDVFGYAPTTTVGNNLELDHIDFDTNDIELPAVSPSQGPWPASLAPVAINTNGLIYHFGPALVVTAGNLDTAFLSINQHAEATFTFTNNSLNTLDEYSFDHVLDFNDGGSGSELMEVESININPAEFDDTISGRSDPTGVTTHYGLLYDNSLTDPDDASLNQFHSTTDSYHNPPFTFDSSVDINGVYQINGNAFVSYDNPCLNDSSCPLIDIDRSDILTIGDVGFETSSTFVFGFTPSRYTGGSSSGLITFDINQYLAYRAPGSPFSQHALYPATQYIQDVQVKSIGLDTSGIVSGDRIYDSGSERDLDIITTTSSADLRREIRKNVAVLTRNMDTTNCAPTLPLTGTLTITATDCIVVDEANNTVIAVYTGSPTDDVLNLGDGTGTVIIPDGFRYTIILIGGLELNIKDNIAYPDPDDLNTSFGIIVMQNPDGEGGNVYLDPEPTNMVGLLYSEGSLLSRDLSEQFYYGAGGDANDLINQLFWQGSIASRNTIGGAANKVVPDKVDCTSWDDNDIKCSQAYDLDFIRRFATVNEAGVEFTPAGYFFSGGGFCNDVAPNPDCDLPVSAPPLPTTVTLLIGAPFSTSIDVAASKSLDTFFIERDNRPAPPGFSSSGGLTSSQEIR